MKLKNKKTGEIAEYISFKDGGPNISFYVYDTAKQYYYNSLAELNEEWEDYEEPKEYWFIDYDGGIIPFSKMKETATDKAMKEIGNYFSSKEEAEKAVEKLKAWKRLKDKGFEFRWIDKEVGTIKYAFFLKYPNMEVDRFDYEDLDLLFGGEE